LVEYQQTDAYKSFVAKQEKGKFICRNMFCLILHFLLHNKYQIVPKVTFWELLNPGTQICIHNGGDLQVLVLFCILIHFIAERERENLSNQKSIETLPKIETPGKEKANESAKKDGGQTNIKEQNTFTAFIGETSFGIPIFSEEFLNYNRSKYFTD
jgi:hypothetical protein